MRNLLLVTACFLVSACLEPKAEVKPQTKPVAAQATNSDCYTVDLFTKAKIKKPDAKVPEKHRQFLGTWGAGAWNGFWCHDLVVTEIHADGRVDLIEMLAPHEPWNYPATAFQRVGRIDEDGNLRFVYGNERLSYRIGNDGRLHGKRSGLYGNLSVKLVRKGFPPIPRRKPQRMAQLAGTTESGS